MVWHNHCRTDLRAQMDVVWLKLASEIAAFCKTSSSPLQVYCEILAQKAPGLEEIGLLEASHTGISLPFSLGKAEPRKRRAQALLADLWKGVENWLQSKNHRIILNGILSKREGSCLWNTTRISTGPAQLLIIYIV